MSQLNKEIVRRVYVDVQDTGNLAAIDELFAPDVLVHDPFMGDVQGVAAYRQLTMLFQNAFPGHKTTLHTFVAEGDFVAIYHIHHATHTGEFMGLPPTGKTVHVPGLELYRLRDGKIVEFWRHDDDAGLMRQLGMLPQAAQ
ncbi:MAG: ester cyclase [Chloroflexi bacterium]|nr:ester cyclase [Chloroflexota bacterium]